MFSQLQDNTTPHAWKHTERSLREAYGDDWRDRIQVKEIIGSGCIGQVYKGIVKDKDGKDQVVAIKGTERFFLSPQSAFLLRKTLAH